MAEFKTIITNLEHLRVTKIRKSARGEDCTLRLEVCNGNPETTVLAHIGHNRGMGIKCADYFAVYACSACHDVIDGRVLITFMTWNLKSSAPWKKHRVYYLTKDY